MMNLKKAAELKEKRDSEKANYYVLVWVRGREQGEVKGYATEQQLLDAEVDDTITEPAHKLPNRELHLFTDDQRVPELQVEEIGF